MNLEKAYERLAYALEKYIWLDVYPAIPKSPEDFDPDLWDSILDDFENPDAMALLVRLAVLNLQDVKHANGLKKSLRGSGDNEGIRHWSRLCNLSRGDALEYEDQSDTSTLQQKIHDSAVGLKRWAVAKTRTNEWRITDAMNKKVYDKLEAIIANADGTSSERQQQKAKEILEEMKNRK